MVFRDGKPQLLVFDVRHGWEPLCEFLDKDIPNRSQFFPPRGWPNTSKSYAYGLKVETMFPGSNGGGGTLLRAAHGGAWLGRTFPKQEDLTGSLAEMGLQW